MTRRAWYLLCIAPVGIALGLGAPLWADVAVACACFVVFDHFAPARRAWWRASPSQSNNSKGSL